MKRTVSVSSLGSSTSGAESPKSVLDYHRCENSPDFQQQQQQKQRFAHPKPPKPSPRPAQGDLRPSSKIVGLELVAALDRQQRGDLSTAVRLTRSSIARVQQLKRSLEAVAEAPSFLRSCCLCKKGIACGRDIYMYRGIQAFCSLDCRDEQIIQDEKEERIARNKHKCLYRKGPNWRAKATMTAAA